MFKALIGSGATGGNRRFSAFIERSDFWAGATASDDLAVDGAGRVAEGLFAGTLVATEQGWVAASELRPGNRVVTFDTGLQTLRAVGRGRLSSPARDLPRAACPLSVPAGALGNRRPMLLLPGQSVLIESDAAEELYGDPFALVPASALEGWKGIARVAPEAEIEVVFPEFDGDEIVYAEGMALVHCARQNPMIVATAEELIAAGSGGHYHALPPAQGRALIAAMSAA